MREAGGGAPRFCLTAAFSGCKVTRHSPRQPKAAPEAPGDQETFPDLLASCDVKRSRRLPAS